MDVTRDTFHGRGWLKDSALMNIPSIARTFETDHAARGWLNAWVSLNMFDMVRTADTSQPWI